MYRYMIHDGQNMFIKTHEKKKSNKWSKHFLNILINMDMYLYTSDDRELQDLDLDGKIT